MAGHRIGRLPVLMLIFTLSMAGFSCRIGAQDIPVIRTVTANTGPGFLTESKFYLAYRPSFPVRNPARSLQDVIDHSDRYEKQISAMFDGKNVDPRIFLWAVYACDSGNTNLAPTASALGQLCAKQFDAARKTGLQLSEKQPEDFRVLVLLAALAAEDTALLPHLEQAFTRSPLKTIYVIDFLSRSGILAVSPDSVFFERFTALIYRNREELRQKKIARHDAARLRNMIARNGEMLSKEMRELCYILDHDTNDGPPSYLPQQFRQ